MLTFALHRQGQDCQACTRPRHGLPRFNAGPPTKEAQQDWLSSPRAEPAALHRRPDGLSGGPERLGLPQRTDEPLAAKSPPCLTFCRTRCPGAARAPGLPWPSSCGRGAHLRGRSGVVMAVCKAGDVIDSNSGGCVEGRVYEVA
jgi:hypothetical protein